MDFTSVNLNTVGVKAKSKEDIYHTIVADEN